MATVALIRSKAYPARQLGSAIDTRTSAVELLRDLISGELGGRPPRQARLPLGDAPTTAPASAQPPWNDLLEKARRDVRSWLARGLDVHSVLDVGYPAPLLEIFNRPALLFVEGSWHLEKDWNAVAVVGARKASAAGLDRARKLATTLAEAGRTVVSGLALGIDTAAHEAALQAGGRTLAVLGTGLDHCYPRTNAALAERIVASGGALLTQFFPHQGPVRWTFPERNIVMSGLSSATVVIEAGEQSGARLQARAALEHCRSVFFPRSLVDSAPWARQMVEDGIDGAHPQVVEHPQEVVDQLTPLLDGELLPF